MSSKSYFLKRQSCEELQKLSAYVIDTIGKDVANPELVVNRIEKHDQIEILLLVFEKWFFRTNSMAVLTIQIVSDGFEQTATVVGTGGGEGILNLDWGANKDFADAVSKRLKTVGFEEMK